MRILMKDLSRPDATWLPVESLPFRNEDELQALLNEEAAELVPVDPAAGDVHMVYAREVSTASGPIDLVGIGSSGTITIMECKLASNHDIKRKVVGQVLDYAASLWGSEVASLAAAFGADPFASLRDKFGSEADAFDEESCRSEVERRLLEGDFRLLIAVDGVDPELWRIIQYVNSRGASGRGLHLVALAFQRYQQGSSQILVPEVVGDELVGAKQSREPSDVGRMHLAYWTEFLEHLNKTGSAIEMRKPGTASIAESKVGEIGAIGRAWNLMKIGKSGVAIHPRSAEAEARFDDLEHNRRSDIEHALAPFGEVLWQLPPDDRSLWIEWQSTPNDLSTWPDLKEHMARALMALWTFFVKPYA